MRDLDGKLQEAENYSNQWKPVSIEIVQDQSENMKVHRIVILIYISSNKLMVNISSLAFP